MVIAIVIILLIAAALAVLWGMPEWATVSLLAVILLCMMEKREQNDS